MSEPSDFDDEFEDEEQGGAGGTDDDEESLLDDESGTQVTHYLVMGDEAAMHRCAERMHRTYGSSGSNAVAHLSCHCEHTRHICLLARYHPSQLCSASHVMPITK